MQFNTAPNIPSRIDKALEIIRFSGSGDELLDDLEEDLEHWTIKTFNPQSKPCSSPPSQGPYVSLDYDNHIMIVDENTPMKSLIANISLGLIKIYENKNLESKSSTSTEFVFPITHEHQRQIRQIVSDVQGLPECSSENPIIFIQQNIKDIHALESIKHNSFQLKL